MRKVSLFALMSCTLFVPACSQSAHQRTSPDTKPSAIDTTFLRDLAETRNFSAGRPSRIQLTPDGAEVLFLRCGPRDVVQNLYELKVADQSVRCLLKAEDLLAGKEESLTAEEKAARERTRETRTGITWYDLSEDGRQILTGLSGRLYTIDRVSGKITALSQSAAGPARDARFSFDGKFVACIRGYDVHVIDLATNEDRALTTGGTQDLAHGVAEFVAAEEMDRRTGYWWSGDSKFIAYTEVDHRDVPMRYIADATHPEVEPSGWRYPNAGANNAIVRLGVIPLAGGETNWADWNRDELPYLATVRSEKDSPMTVYVQSRDQQSAVLCRLDPATAELSELLAEKDAAWINIEPGMPRWLKDSTFLWISEVSGEKQLELRAADGAKMRIIPAESERFEGLVAIDQTTGEFIIRAGAWPSESHLYRVGHTAGNLRGARLSEGRGEHSAVFSKNGDTWVQSSALADGRETQTLRRRDGAVLGELPSVAEKPPFVPNTEWTRVTIHDREHEVAIQRPRDFKPSRKYPVIESVYGGPGSNVVTTANRHYLRNQWIADQGFIVVQTDARGTPDRGPEWERAIHGNLIEAPLADHAAIVQALCKKYSEMDGSRVGIYGWSFGGYFSTMAVLKRPDVYHAAVAGAPVIDWRDYDTHYTERYMGLPSENADGYRACDATTYAADLSRPLLLIHGTTDDNVYFQHSLKMSDALYRAGKDFEFLALTGFTHMVPDPLVTTRLYERIVRFFQKNLGGPARR